MVRGASSTNGDHGVRRRLKKWLEIPELSGLSLDEAYTAELRRSVIQRKAFLQQIYCEWYSLVQAAAASTPSGLHVELGSGGGFFKELFPQLITSDVLQTPDLDLVFSATAMPLKDESVAAFYLVDVLHHVQQPVSFFEEAVRCMKPGGKILMIEPYNTWWGRFVYRTLHNEPFDANAGWEIGGNRPLSDANVALPWILFERDLDAFREAFPELRMTERKPFMPFAYLLSGGVSIRSLLPGACYPIIRQLEKLLGPLNRYLGMFAHITLEKHIDP